MRVLFIGGNRAECILVGNPQWVTYAMTKSATTRPQSSFRSQAGFTFLEIVIALVLLAFVGGIILSILSNSRRATTETRTQVTRQMTLRTINELIEVDLEKTRFAATAPGGVIAKAPNGTGAQLRLIDDSTITYYLNDGTVYRQDSGNASRPAGERPAAQEVASIEFTADASARTITVRVTPLVPGGGGAASAFAVDMTRLVRNP